jgi:hypothetical protein
VLDLDAVVHDFPDRVASRAERPPDIQEVVPDVRDLAADARSRPVLDVIVELVDFFVDSVDQVEVGLRDLVDDPVGEDPGRVVWAARLPCRGGVEGLPASRRLPDRHDRVRADDQVNLLVVDVVLDVLEHRHEHDAVYAVMDGKQAGPRRRLPR